MKYKVFILFLFILPSLSLAQTKIDSLQRVLKQTSDGETKIKILKDLSLAYWRNKQDNQAYNAVKEAIKVAQRSHNIHKEADMHEFLGRLYYSSHKDKLAIISYKNAIHLFDSIKQPLHSARVHKRLARLYLRSNEITKSFQTCLVASERIEEHLKKQANDKEAISLEADIYIILGTIAYKQKRLNKAIEYYAEAVESAKKIDLKNTLMVAYMNWGVMLKQQSKNKEALLRYEKAYAISLELKDKHTQADLLNNIGSLYLQEKNYDKALEYNIKSLELRKAQGKDILPATLNNIAFIYAKKGDFEEAEKYYQNSLSVARKLQRLDYEVPTLLSIAELYEIQDDLSNAIKYFKKYNIRNDSLNKLVNNKAVLEMGTKYETEKKERENELLRNQSLLQQSTIETQILKEEQLKLAKEKEAKENKIKAYIIEKQKLEEEKLKTESEKRKKENEVLKKTEEAQSAKLSAQNAQIRQQYTTIIAVGIGLALLFILAGILYRNNRQKQRSNILLHQQKEEIQAKNNELETQKQEIQIKSEEIQVQNEELHQQQEEIITQRDYIESQHQELSQKNNLITSSINAALTIQEAILPLKEKVVDFLPDYFTLFKPRDVVSGDFYWIEKVENYSFIVVADCTGHGVPGAFMAMIGHTLLDKIITSEKMLSPAQILERLHREVEKVLRQKTTGNNSGMDMLIVRIENQNNNNYQVVFAGAKRPLYYWRHQTQEIEILKTSRKSIGGIQNDDIQFTAYNITAQKNDLLYLCSDGYADQNNFERKSFGNRRFQSLLSEIAHKPLEIQNEILEQKLNIHMENTEQRDDILVLGVKL